MNNQLFRANLRNALICLCFLVLPGLSSAALVSADLDGAKSGNDSEANILANFEPVPDELAKIEHPATSNDGLALNALVLNPGALWLLGSALAGLTVLRGKRRESTRTFFVINHFPTPRAKKLFPFCGKEDVLLMWKRNVLTPEHEFPGQVRSVVVSPERTSGFNLGRILDSFKFIFKNFILLFFSKSNTVYTVGMESLFAGVLAKSLSPFSSGKLVFDLYDIPSGYFKSVTKKRFYDFFFKRCDEIVLASPYFADVIGRENCKVVENLPLEMNFPSKSSAAQYNYPTALNIAFVGMVRYENMLSDFCDALKNEDSININFHGLCLKDTFKHEYEHQKNVNFTGSFGYSDLPNIYADTDVVLCTYDYKIDNVRVAIPNKLYESIFFKKPIIVSSHTKLAEFVKEKGIGIAIDTYDEKSIALGLIELQEKYAEMKKNLNKIDAEKYLFSNYSELLQEMFSAPRQPQLDYASSKYASSKIVGHMAA